MSGEGEILKRNGFGFKKKFGQNFLSDQNLLRAIAEDAGVEKTTTVLEIGAGAGALTRILAGCARRVVAYEIDPDLKPVLAETLKGCENAEVVFRDFMREDLPALEKELKEYVVVANLPYYITTPVVLRFLEEAALCRGITVMVQEEVAAALPPVRGRPNTAPSLPRSPSAGRARSREKYHVPSSIPAPTSIRPSSASVLRAASRCRARRCIAPSYGRPSRAEGRPSRTTS